MPGRVAANATCSISRDKAYRSGCRNFQDTIIYGSNVKVVGGVDGTFKGNRHIVFPDNTQRTSNLLLSILHKYGFDQDSFGSSTGPLPGLV